MARNHQTQPFQPIQPSHAGCLPYPKHEFTLFVMAKLIDRMLSVADVAQLHFLAGNPVNMRDWQIAQPAPPPAGDEVRAVPSPVLRKTQALSGIRGNSDTWFLQPADIPTEMVEYIIAISPPARFFDRDAHATLVRATLASLSLDLTEKQRVFDAVDTLSGWQYDQLIEVFSEESEKFRKLSFDHPEDILLLSARTTLGLFAMLTLRGLYPDPAAARRGLVEMVDRQCMRAPELHTVVSRRSLWPPLIDEVYGHLLVEAV
jgi:hypothetical protein